MKILKTLLLAAFLLASFVVVNQYASPTQHNIGYTDLRVRVVPGSSDQKKKDSQHSNTPKTDTASKNSSGFFCNQNNNVKTRLTLINGGSPK